MRFLLDSFLLTTLTLLILLIFTLILYGKHAYQYWEQQGLTQLTPSFPFGNFKDIFLKKQHIGAAIASMHEYFKARNQIFGGYYVCFRPELLVIHPEAIRNILVKDFQFFTEKQLIVDEINEPLTVNLFFVGGTKWQTLRSKLTPIFTAKKLKIIFGSLLETAEELNKIIENATKTNKLLNITDIAAEYTTDAILSCGFGVNGSSLQNANNEFRKYGEMVTSPQGLRFGLMQIKVGLVVLLRNHRFTLNEKTRVPLIIDTHKFSLAPHGGIWLDAEYVQ